MLNNDDILADLADEYGRLFINYRISGLQSESLQKQLDVSEEKNKILFEANDVLLKRLAEETKLREDLANQVREKKIIKRKNA